MISSKRLVSLIFISLFAVVPSCDLQDDNNYDLTHQFFTVLIEGISWTPTPSRILAGYDMGGAFYVGAIEFGNTARDVISLNIHLNSVVFHGAGTYLLPRDGWGHYSHQAWPDSIGYDYSTSASDTGQLVINSWNGRLGGYIQGTFGFRAVDARRSDTVAITEGYFNAVFTPGD